MASRREEVERGLADLEEPSSTDCIEDLKLLLDCLRYHHDNGSPQRQALTTIAAMCCNDSIARDEVRSSGVLFYVLELALAGPAEGTMQAALLSLGCACEGNVVNQMKLCQSRIFSLLSQILTAPHSGHTLLHSAAYLTGCLMAGNGTGQNLANESNTLQALASLFKALLPSLPTPSTVSDVTCVSGEGVEGWRSVVSALCTATNNPQNDTNQLLCSAVFPAALSLLSFIPQSSSSTYTSSSSHPPHITHHTAHVVQSALSLITSCIASNVTVQSRLRMVGGLHCLVTALKRVAGRNTGGGGGAGGGGEEEEGGRERSGDESNEGEVRVHLVQCIAASAFGHASNSILLCSLGVVPLLLSLLHPPSLPLPSLLSLTLCLGTLTEDNMSAQVQVVECGGLPLLVGHMADYKDEELSKTVTFVLQCCLQRKAPSQAVGHSADEQATQASKAIDHSDPQKSVFSADTLQPLDHHKMPVSTKVSSWLHSNQSSFSVVDYDTQLSTGIRGPGIDGEDRGREVRDDKKGPKKLQLRGEKGESEREIGGIEIKRNSGKEERKIIEKSGERGGEEESGGGGQGLDTSDTAGRKLTSTLSDSVRGGWLATADTTQVQGETSRYEWKEQKRDMEMKTQEVDTHIKKEEIPRRVHDLEAKKNEDDLVQENLAVNICSKTERHKRAQSPIQDVTNNTTSRSDNTARICRARSTNPTTCCSVSEHNIITTDSTHTTTNAAANLTTVKVLTDSTHRVNAKANASTIATNSVNIVDLTNIPTVIPSNAYHALTHNATTDTTLASTKVQLTTATPLTPTNAAPLTTTNAAPLTTTNADSITVSNPAAITTASSSAVQPTASSTTTHHKYTNHTTVTATTTSNTTTVASTNTAHVADKCSVQQCSTLTDSEMGPTPHQLPPHPLTTSTPHHTPTLRPISSTEQRNIRYGLSHARQHVKKNPPLSSSLLLPAGETHSYPTRENEQESNYLSSAQIKHTSTQHAECREEKADKELNFDAASIGCKEKKHEAPKKSIASKDVPFIPNPHSQRSYPSDFVKGMKTHNCPTSNPSLRSDTHSLVVRPSHFRSPCPHFCLGCRPRIKCPNLTSRTFLKILQKDQFTCAYHRRVVKRMGKGPVIKDILVKKLPTQRDNSSGCGMSGSKGRYVIEKTSNISEVKHTKGEAKICTETTIYSGRDELETARSKEVVPTPLKATEEQNCHQFQLQDESSPSLPPASPPPSLSSLYTTAQEPSSASHSTSNTSLSISLPSTQSSGSDPTYHPPHSLNRLKANKTTAKISQRGNTATTSCQPLSEKTDIKQNKTQLKTHCSTQIRSTSHYLSHYVSPPIDTHSSIRSKCMSSDSRPIFPHFAVKTAVQRAIHCSPSQSLPVSHSKKTSTTSDLTSTHSHKELPSHPIRADHSSSSLQKQKSQYNMKSKIRNENILSETPTENYNEVKPVSALLYSLTHRPVRAKQAVRLKLSCARQPLKDRGNVTQASGSVYDYTTPHKDKRAEVEVEIGGGREGERGEHTKTEQGKRTGLLGMSKDLVQVHSTASSQTHTSSQPRKRVPFSALEEAYILDGVQRLGLRWRHILSAYPFHQTRTSVDLKDKYRNLKGRRMHTGLN